jgi:shikimate kinase
MDTHPEKHLITLISESHPCIAIVGMNGIGKSHLGKGIASKLGMKRIDTDIEFRKLHGDEHACIDAHGWDFFRYKEAEIVCRSLKPDHVVVLGGGAIESDAVRATLREHAIVVWMQGEHNRTRKNLKISKRTRPELKGKITRDNVKSLLAKRNPLYEEVADVVLYPHTRYKDHVQAVIGLLNRFIMNADQESRTIADTNSLKHHPLEL